MNNLYNDLQNKESTSLVRPLIFTKKVNDKSKVIPLSESRNTLGQTKHFPAATREWFNSVYHYNNHAIKNLPIADKTMTKLLKSYFNLYFKSNIFDTKRIAIRFKRLDLKKIFFSRAELKHTNNKVIITLYVYNEERRLLSRNILELKNKLFPFKGDEVVENNEDSLFHDELLLTNEEKEKAISDLLNKFSKLGLSLPLDSNSNDLKVNLHKEIIKSHLEEELMTIAYYKLLLNLNRSKFEDNFLSKLKPLIRRIYNKEVEFNIVNLNHLSFNSDIFTQAISIKLKNRNNRLLKVLKSSLKLIDIPFINKMRERYGKDNKDQVLLNRVKNLKVNNGLLRPEVRKQDLLSELLSNVFPTSFVERSNNENSILRSEQDDLLLSNEEKQNNLEDLVIGSLKYKSLAGVRLEARGRLTKRLTASRSVFKVKWKGSLKNIDSSYRGLSSVILRGHLKPNLQYSVMNSKNRNGSFGLKGWIAHK